MAGALSRAHGVEDPAGLRPNPDPTYEKNRIRPSRKTGSGSDPQKTPRIRPTNTSKICLVMTGS